MTLQKHSWQTTTPWALQSTELLEHLDVAPDLGLSQEEADYRLSQVGPNRLAPPATASRLSILLSQFRGALVALLACASTVSFVVGDWVEALAILSVLFINAALGFVTELRASRSMEALRNLQGARAIVRRAGHQEVIDAKMLVPGDIVIVEAGDRISADLRVIDSAQLQADESSLTGESVPVEKREAPALAAEFIGDRSCMLHSGTTITAGAGEAVVVATGIHAEVGKIAGLVSVKTTRDTTPLEKRLDALGQTLLWVTLAMAALVAAGGIGSGKDPLLIFETAIALAIASVPEGLPIIATLILGRGVHRMARRKALIQRLAAVETLGATGLICTDKTGTLTENRLRVDQIVGIDGNLDMAVDDARHALELVSLCNHAELGASREEDAGDPLEVALLLAARDQGIVCDRKSVREAAFDPLTRMMATVHRRDPGYLVAVKGAPEAVVAVTTPTGDSERWLARAEEMARRGLRVIAVANKTMPSAEGELYRDLEMVALFGLLDPPRKDVAEAIASCRLAGIIVCMMTGDHPETARQIAARVGIIDDDAQASVLSGSQLAALDWHSPEGAELIGRTQIFARVSPEQKYELVRFHQKRGTIVAMTGDGVNDAPALRRADIGIAMGLRGTEVAREASDMVLLDDRFATLVAAVKEGRGIFQNIRSFVVYLLSCNLSEILIIGLATAVRAPLPLLPLQILFLNLVTDVFPALALGANETDPKVMQDPPRRPGQTILGRDEWRHIVGYGLIITSSVLAAFFLALDVLHLSPLGIVTVSFITLALAQMWHVFNMRSPGTGTAPVMRNPFVWGALAFCSVLVGTAVYWPPAAGLLTLEPLLPAHLALCVGLSVVPLGAGVLWRRVTLRFRPLAGPGPGTRPCAAPSR